MFDEKIKILIFRDYEISWLRYLSADLSEVITYYIELFHLNVTKMYTH